MIIAFLVSRYYDLVGLLHCGATYRAINAQLLCLWWLFWPIQNDAHGYSSESTLQKLFNEYKHDRV